MIPPAYSKSDFRALLFEQNCIPKVYEKVVLGQECIPLVVPFCAATENRIFRNFVVQHFPDYLTPKISSEYKVYKRKTKKGYAIHLRGITNAEDYFNGHLKRSSKKAIRRALNRFEHCFDVSYKMFFGSIPMETYNHLMTALHKMISHRFRNKYTSHYALRRWKYYHALFYRLVRERRGSIFVIYDKDTPVEISLNFNIGNIMLSAFSSFDADYSKFSLGNIEIYKQLEWCLENGYILFDMSYGDFKYKMDWSNLHYDFETHVISCNWKGTSLANFIEMKERITDYLLKREMNHTYHRVKGILKWENSKETDAPWEDCTLEKVRENEEEKLAGLSTINIKDSRWAGLRKYVYDYMYLEQKRIQDISIYQKSDTEFFIINN